MVDKSLNFSATMLQDYLDCKRRFEYKYILQRSWPAVVSEPLEEFIRHTNRGRDFHSMVHQYFSGLPLDTVRAMDGDTQVIGWFENFIKFINSFTFKIVHSEFRMHSKIAAYHLTAVYDLFAFTNESSPIIFDWKTSTVQPRRSRLQPRIQTTLYPFILWENYSEIVKSHTPLLLNNIKMIYWFAQFPDEPVEFLYDAQAHADTQAYLMALLDRISNTIQNGDFPFTDNLRYCSYCPYRSLCDRGVHAGNFSDDQDLDAEQLAASINLDSIDMIEPDLE